MIGSPSGDTGIGPLMSCFRPSSPNAGMRSAVATAISSKRSMFGGSSSCANSNGTPRGWNDGVPISQPPTAKPPTSGLR